MRLLLILLTLSSRAASAAAESEFTLGVVVPLTGPVAEYRAAYADPAQMKFAAEGYDVANLIRDSFCAGGVPVDGERIVNILAATAPRDGAQGHTVFRRSEKGDKFFSAPIVVMRVSGGAFVPVE